MSHSTDPWRLRGGDGGARSTTPVPTGTLTNGLVGVGRPRQVDPVLDVERHDALAESAR